MIIEIAQYSIYIDGKICNRDYFVDFYNGISRDSRTHCITFSMFAELENLQSVNEIILDYENGISEIITDILSTDVKVDAITVRNWSKVEENKKADVVKLLSDKNYLFETNFDTDIFYASNEHFDDIKSSQPNVTSDNIKRYKIECEISTVGDIFSLVYNTFSEVANLKVYPIVSAVPIKILDGECKTPDYTLFVYPDGISLIFDPISRETGSRFVLNKPVDEDVIKWLESMDSEQIYKMAQLTFTKL